jgi:hypothetical protein
MGAHEVTWVATYLGFPCRRCLSPYLAAVPFPPTFPPHPRCALPHRVLPPPSCSPSGCCCCLRLLVPSLFQDLACSAMDLCGKHRWRVQGNPHEEKLGMNPFGCPPSSSPPATAAQPLTPKSPPWTPASSCSRTEARRTRGPTQLGFPSSSPGATLVIVPLFQTASMVACFPV